MNKSIKSSFVIKIPRSALKEIKNKFQSWGNKVMFSIYHPEDKENGINLNKNMNKFIIEKWE